MKLPVEVTLKGGQKINVECGPRAISDAERRYDFTLTGASKSGLAVESIAYMAWTQAARDEKYLGPWSDFWDALDDLEVKASPDADPQ